MKDQRIVTFLLASGPTTLIGELNKFLQPNQKKSQIRRTAQALLAARTGPVIVILGHDAQKIHGELYDLNVEFVLDSDYRQGALSSLQKGLRNYVGAMDAFMVVSGDQEITRSSVSTLANYFQQNPGMILAAPHQGRKGQPVLMSSHFATDILEQENLNRDITYLFKKNPQRVHLIELHEPYYQPLARDFEMEGHM